jgi:hypothetical protein
MVLIPEKNMTIPLHRGIFFILSILLMILSGCGNNAEKKTAQDASTSEREDEFVLLGFRNSVLDLSVQMMAGTDVFKTGKSDRLNTAYIGEESVPVEIDMENAYACIYPDGRHIAYYPLTDMHLPKLDETLTLGFLHYFDSGTMNMFFEVLVSLPKQPTMLPDSPAAPPHSEYEIQFLGPNKKPYGIARSRLLNKSDLSEEEAFRKYETSSRTVLLGTNSFDEDKFFVLFLKLDELESQLFQVYMKWY